MTLSTDPRLYCHMYRWGYSGCSGDHIPQNADMTWREGKCLLELQSILELQSNQLHCLFTAFVLLKVI